MAAYVVCCGIFGEATRFGVSIPRDERTATLQDVISDAMPPSDYPTTPSMLNLYLARKDGAWIKSSTRIKPHGEDFTGEPIDQALELMDPMENLSVYLGNGRYDDDERGVLHVMIQRPPRIYLCCGIFGEATRLGVSIPPDAQITTLRDAVFNKMPPSDYMTKLSMLNLFLARKDGAWIKSSTRIKPHGEDFTGEPIDPALEFMDPRENLSVYLGNGRYDDNERGVLHVMIQRPPRIYLCCGIFGEDTRFFAPIPRDAHTATLQDVISDVMPPSDYMTKPSMLKLYLAWKDGAWIKSTTRIKTHGEDFAGEPIDQALEFMDPMEKLSVYLGDGRYDDNERGVLHVMIERPRRPPLHDDEQPAKRQRVERDMRLRELWPLMDWKLGKLPPVDELEALLRKPLPFQLDLFPQTNTDGVSQPSALPVECWALEDQINGYLSICESPPETRATVKTWRLLYNTLTLLTTTLLQADNVRVQRMLLDGAETAVERNRPDCFLHVDGLVLMRGDLNAMGVDMDARYSASSMHLWNPIFYGNLPYVIGFVASGSFLQVRAMEKCNQSFRRTLILELDAVRQPAEAIKAFFNLALLLREMVRHVKRPFRSDLLPFLPFTNDNRTIVMLDNSVVRTIKLVPSVNDEGIQRLHEVYTALSNLKSEGSETTHLQTVETLSAVEDGDLVIELSPIGCVRRPKLSEVGNWLRQLLTALTYWHRCDYCHGDIRKSKIIYVPTDDSGYWVLIGMDKSHKPGTTIINWSHKYLNKRLQFQHDLYQLGKLMEEMGYNLPDHLKTMQTILLSGIDSPELTAEKALTKLKVLLQDLPPAPLSRGRMRG